MTRVGSMSMCNHLPAAGAAPADQGRCPGTGSGGVDPSQVRSVDPLVDQPPHRGRRRHRTEDVLTVAAQVPDTVDAVRPVGDRGSQVSEHLPGARTPTGRGRCLLTQR